MSIQRCIKCFIICSSAGLESVQDSGLRVLIIEAQTREAHRMICFPLHVRGATRRAAEAAAHVIYVDAILCRLAGEYRLI